MENYVMNLPKNNQNDILSLKGINCLEQLIVKYPNNYLYYVDKGKMKN